MLKRDFHGLTMSKYPKVSVIILNYNGKKIISECVDAALQSSYPNIEVVIVDNGSFDGSQTYLRLRYGKHNKIRLVFSQINLQFAGGFNLGAQKSRGTYIFLVSSDVIVDKNCVAELVLEAKRHKKGFIQPKILSYWKKKAFDNAGGSYSIFGVGKGLGGNESDWGQYDQNRSIDFTAATTFLAPKKFFIELGGYDEWFVSHYEDVDLCLRAKKSGGSSWFAYRAICHHKISITFKKYVMASELLFNIRKNRLRTVLKNYEGAERIIRVLALIPMYAVTLITDLLFQQDKAITFKALIAAITYREQSKYVSTKNASE